MLEFIKRAKILFLASIAAIAAFTYFVIYGLLESRLEITELEKFMELGNSGYHTLEQSISAFTQGAQTLSGRTITKNEIVNYNLGLVDFNGLISYTESKYGTDAGMLEDVVYAQRVVDERVIAYYSTGKIDRYEKPAMAIGEDELSLDVVDIDRGIYAVVNSPIISNDKLLGTDNVIFDMTAVVNGLSGNKVYDIGIVDAEEFAAIKADAFVAMTGSLSKIYESGGYYIFSRQILGADYLCIKVPVNCLLEEIRSISLKILVLTVLFFAGLLMAFYFYLFRFAHLMLHLSEKSREDYQDLAFRDKLTGVYSRAFLDFWSKNIFRYDIRYCLALIDLDCMKSINDTYGHMTGDDVLKSFASLIRKSVRRGDVVVRFGGDEFLIILENADEENGRHVMEHIAADLGANESYGFNTSFSYGISGADKESGLKEAIEKADAEMYRQKDEKKHKGGSPA